MSRDPWEMALLIFPALIIILSCVVVGRAIVKTCWYCFLHTCLKPCGVDPLGAGRAIESPDDGRPVTPIFSIRSSYRGGRLCQPNDTGTPGYSDLPTALSNRDGNELNRFFIVIEDVKKIQKQNRCILQKQEIESKKHYEEIKNQTKQINLLKNQLHRLYYLKNSQNSNQKTEKVETELITGNFDRSVNPISSRDGTLSPPSTVRPSGFSNLATALQFKATLVRALTGDSEGSESRPVVSGGSGGAMALPDFGRLVNLI